MANSGPPDFLQASQFIVTLHEMGAPWLDGKNCVFGQVRAKSLEVLRMINERCGRDGEGKPRRSVQVKRAGIVLPELLGLDTMQEEGEEDDGDGDGGDGGEGADEGGDDRAGGGDDDR